MDQENSNKVTAIFDLAVESVHASLLPPIALFALSEDLFECCPESQLKEFFPILEEMLHGDKQTNLTNEKEVTKKKVNFSSEDLH